jgi:hypothetical protein
MAFVAEHCMKTVNQGGSLIVFLSTVRAGSYHRAVLTGCLMSGECPLLFEMDLTYFKQL